MKIYLSGPMRGLPNDNREKFNHYAAVLRAQGHIVFNPAEEDERLFARGETPCCRNFFRQDMLWICEQAEAIAMMPGWETSRGANAEHALAKALGDVKYIYLE